MHHPIIMQQILSAPKEKVWAALTTPAQMHQWYFEVQGFEPKVGNTFEFGDDIGENYLHRCKILEVEPQKKLVHTWGYPDLSAAETIVKWELEALGECETQLILSHSGIEQFADLGPNFQPASFQMGWDALIGSNLKNHLNGIIKLKYEMDIKATPEKIWETLWGAGNYAKWMAPFAEGTKINGVMEEGERLSFVNGNNDGIYSDLLFFREPRVAVFKHIGNVKNGVEQPMDEATEKWSGSFEQYRLQARENGETKLLVELDSLPEYAPVFNEIFPAALQIVQQMAAQ